MNSNLPSGGDKDGSSAGKPPLPRSPRAALEPERVPLPSRHLRRVRHPIVVVGNAIFTLLVVVSIAIGAGLFIGKQRFEAPGPLAEDKVVNIPRGLGIRDIADLLQREGVIDQPYVFMGGVIVLKARGELKYGEYQFSKQSSVSNVVATIIEGKVVQHIFTVPEGLTSEQIVARLLENSALAGQIKEIPREGTLLPETYRFTRGMTREQIILRMTACPLVDAWRAVGASETDIDTLCAIASAVDEGTFETAGLELTFLDRLGRPGADRCLLQLRPAARS